jgi:pimeloyl-ACP methyl ester carboxylesterase
VLHLPRDECEQSPAVYAGIHLLSMIGYGLLALLALLLCAVLAVAAVWERDRPLAQLIDRWARAPSAFIEVKGQIVHLRDDGPRDDPVPVVLIHGTASSLFTWEGWMNGLKGERRVITMDLPGFGLTGPSPQNDYHIAAYTQFLLDLLDMLDVRRCVVGGNSLGGYIAWKVALAAPQRVERLILVAAGGYPIHSETTPLLFKLALLPGIRDLTVRIQSRRVLEMSMRSVFGDPARVTPEMVERQFEIGLRAGNRRALLSFVEQMRIGADAERIRKLKLPTLILWGGRDRQLPVADAYRFQHDIAGSELVIFDDLGHGPHVEDPSRSLAPVERFLRRRESRTSHLAGG